MILRQISVIRTYLLHKAQVLKKKIERFLFCLLLINLSHRSEAKKKLETFYDGVFKGHLYICLLETCGKIDCLIDLYIVLCHAWKYFIHMETSQLSVKGCKSLVYARHICSLYAGSVLGLYRATSVVKWPWFLLSLLKDRHKLVAYTISKGTFTVDCSYPDSHGDGTRKNNSI